MKSNPKVIFSKLESYDLDLVLAHLEKMFDALGGLDKFVSSGDKVLLKPNLVLKSTREKCALTDPCIIEAVIKLLKKIPVEIFLGDSPAFGSSLSVAKCNGIKQICDRYGVKIISFKNNKKVFSEEHSFHWSVSDTLSNFDKIINLPKLKGHQQLYYTGAVKNLFGCIAGKKKFFHHMIEGDADYRFGKMLIEIASLVNPVLNIMDGIWAMAGNGPLKGEPVNVGLLGISTSPLLLDLAVCQELSADFDELDIYQAAKRIYKEKDFLLPNIQWLTERANFEKFYFPESKIPIRFSIKHALKSTFNSLHK
ncbi:MAG: hypothetical protein COA79_11510 [Planctomycetota bacterium]|nr:MAG: hypothetical protein COA79_11510 [Planctomycetota bacterium]